MMTATTQSDGVPAFGLYVRESVAEIRKSVRLPQFMIPTVLTPAAFYGLFAIAMSKGDVATTTYALATFGVFAAIGPALFGFGAGVAVERETGLIELKRVSPLPAGAYVAAKLAAALGVTAAALALIYALGVFGGARLPATRWAAMIAIHLASSIPFALIGFGLGMRLGSKGAIGAANALFLALAVIGGLWMPITSLPGWMQSLAWVMPSYHLGELALAAAGFPRPGSGWVHAAVLAALTMAALAWAWLGWRRSAA